MEVNNRMIGSVAILEISGDVDLYSASELKENISQILYMKKMILDLKKVNYIDSSGLGVLCSTHTELKKSGGALKLVGVTDTVMNLFKMTRLIRFFEIFKDEKTAHASYYPNQ